MKEKKNDVEKHWNYRNACKNKCGFTHVPMPNTLTWNIVILLWYLHFLVLSGRCSKASVEPAVTKQNKAQKYEFIILFIVLFIGFVRFHFSRTVWNSCSLYQHTAKGQTNTIFMWLLSTTETIIITSATTKLSVIHRLWRVDRRNVVKNCYRQCW